MLNDRYALGGRRLSTLVAVQVILGNVVTYISDVVPKVDVTSQRQFAF